MFKEKGRPQRVWKIQNLTIELSAVHFVCNNGHRRIWKSDLGDDDDAGDTEEQLT